MVIRDDAQVELILASNDGNQTQQLQRDIKASKFVYSFVHLSDRASLVSSIARHIAANAGRTPLVIVVDYRFAGSDCEVILQVAKDAAPIATIECVVTDPPRNDAVRQRLTGLGAKLFEGDSAEFAGQFTLH